MNPSIPLPSIEPFQCNPTLSNLLDGNPGSVSLKWENWRRSLMIYLNAENIEDPSKKTAMLLHLGGLRLQEIYFNLPVCDIDESGGDEFCTALLKLDEYFASKKSYVLERYVLRMMKQEREETIEDFVFRLEEQSTKCGYINTEEHLIDQIVEKCYSEELRKKILQNGDNITLKDIIIEATKLENLSRQLEDSKQASTSKVDKCSRCGSFRPVAAFEGSPDDNMVRHCCRKKQSRAKINRSKSSNKRKSAKNKKTTLRLKKINNVWTIVKNHELGSNKSKL